MKINWKLRLKNKVTLLSLIAITITFIYQILGLFEIAVPISEDQVTQIAGIIINILVAIGVIVDPTTAGASDSERALSYEMPNKGE